MARVVVLGAGISGHTAALHLHRLLGKGHEVVVVSPTRTTTGFRPISGLALAG